MTEATIRLPIQSFSFPDLTEAPGFDRTWDLTENAEISAAVTGLGWTGPGVTGPVPAQGTVFTKVRVETKGLPCRDNFRCP